MAWQFAASLAAVALLVLLAWKWGHAGAPRLSDEEEARSLADAVPGGFAATRVSTDHQGHGALLQDQVGRVVLVAPAGAHFVARLLGPNVRVVRIGGELTVSGPDISARLNLGSEADSWAKAIERLE